MSRQPKSLAPKSHHQGYFNMTSVNTPSNLSYFLFGQNQVKPGVELSSYYQDDRALASDRNYLFSLLNGQLDQMDLRYEKPKTNERSDCDPEQDREKTKSFLRVVRKTVEMAIDQSGIPMLTQPDSLNVGVQMDDEEDSEVLADHSDLNSYVTPLSDPVRQMKDDRKHLVDMLSLRVWSDRMRLNEQAKLGEAYELDEMQVEQIRKFVQLYLAQFPTGYMKQQCDGQLK